MAIWGKIVIDSIRYITNPRPRNLKRPSAYAANEPMASESSVTDPATIVELMRASWKNEALSALRWLSRVGLLGIHESGVVNRSPSGVKDDRIAQKNGKRA